MKKLSHKIRSSEKTSHKSSLRRIINEGKVLEYSKGLDDPLDAPYFTEMVDATVRDADFLDLEDDVVEGMVYVKNALKRQHPNNGDISFEIIEDFIQEAVEQVELNSEGEDNLREQLEEVWKSS